MEREAHWEEVYETKSPTEVSWYQPHLTKSLELVTDSGIDKDANIIDVGGGASALADDLLANGYKQISVLDISSKAIETSKKRLAKKADRITWIKADILRVNFPESCFDLWHDRALFHFLTDPNNRRDYISLVTRSLKSGGSLILATFGPEGPIRCSGLDIVRYSPQTLHNEFGQGFDLIKALVEGHNTPAGKIQPFTYCLFRKK